MSTKLYLAPAAGGKTVYALDLARHASQGLKCLPRVVVSSHLQARACRQRLAEAGGALGVRVLTFQELYAQCLGAGSRVFTSLSDPVQYRLIRAVVDALPLKHYAPLAKRPGFVQTLHDLMDELKAARVEPTAFAAGVLALGDPPRLAELAGAYEAYQERLRTLGWADRAGLAWLAAEAVEEDDSLCRDWGLVLVDGFDSFTGVQLALLRALAPRVGELIITLTGTGEAGDRPLTHRRLDQTRRDLEAGLGVRAEPLPQPSTGKAPVLAHLEAHLFRGETAALPSGGAMDLIEAPDRQSEVRAALRWLKARLVADGLQPGQVSLLARSVAPYRSFIVQTAAEFGLAVRLVDGLPLRRNPAVAALLDLLRLALPVSPTSTDPALPRRLVVEAWRSPYFDWSLLSRHEAPGPDAPMARDADALDAVARWGLVIGGLSQWHQALDALAGWQDEADEGQEERPPADVPTGPAAQALRLKFDRFVARLVPPQGERSCADLAAWLEDLIGPDPELPASHFAAPEEPDALQVVARARQAVPPVAERDVAALQALKDVLRGLVWAEQALETAEAMTYPRFVEELAGSVEPAVYHLPFPAEPAERDEAILVADVVQARGLPFRAVAVLGLAEGEFPAMLSEDPFLRDADRLQLRQECGLPLELSTLSTEAGYFYETLCRPRGRLLLTRPRLADNGSPWQPSPFWEEVRRLVDVQPVRLSSESVPPPAEAASWPELMESVAARRADGQVRQWMASTNPARLPAWQAATQVLRWRRSRRGEGSAASDGDLSSLAGAFQQQYGPGSGWSASRLETYRTCAFYFFVSYVLHLEPRQEPVEGLDAAQLGTIYHRVLESLYRAAADPADAAELLAALPAAAAAVLDEAPRRDGFRVTAWWAQTRAAIQENVRASVQAMADAQGDFVPWQHEAAFGRHGRPALVVRDGDDSFRLAGFIDRVDRDPAGHVRIIDYKTSSPQTFIAKAVEEGKKLQLPLYALAARDALGLGEPVDGFYWHVRHAKASALTLRAFPGGPAAAIAVATAKAWEAVRGARGGYFVPRPPADGCPSYCPAAGFCWHYRSGFGG